MKKLIFIAVLLLSFTAANAQLTLGVKAGFTSSLDLSNLGSVTTGTYNLNSVQSEMWNNFHGGVFARVGLGKMIYIQPELLYAIGKKNYQLTPKDVVTGGITADKFVTISTVDVPLLVGVKLIDLKVVNLRAFAGPKLRFNAGSPLAFDNITGSGTSAQSLEASVRAAQVGLEAGVGVDVLMFTLDARYNLIGDMYTTKINTLSLSNLPNNTFVISLGYKLF